MFSPPISAGQKPPRNPTNTSSNDLRKVSEVSVDRNRQFNVHQQNQNQQQQPKRTSSSSSGSAGIKRRPSSTGVSASASSSLVIKPTPEIELYATLIDATTTAFQNRAPSLVLPPNVSANLDKTLFSSSSNPTTSSSSSAAAPPTLQTIMQQFYTLSQEALLAFSSLELSTSATEKSRVSTKQTDTGSYSTSVVANLGESAATVAKRTELLMEIMKQLSKVFATEAPSSSRRAPSSLSSSSLAIVPFLPASFKKSVASSLKQGSQAVDEIRLSAKAIHSVRKAIVSRDLEAAQLLLIDQTALDAAGNNNNNNNSNSNFLPSLLLRWLRRHWIPSMKIWNEISDRFEEESARIVKQNQLKLQSDDDALAILKELIKKYRQEILKKSQELNPITLPGQSLEQLIVDSIEKPLSKNLDLLKKKAQLLDIFKQGIENLNMVALSQAVKEWKRDFITSSSSSSNNNNKDKGKTTATISEAEQLQQQPELYKEAKRTIERLQSLGKITAGLTMAQQQKQSSSSSDTDTSSFSSSSLRTTISALHQTASLILKEQWYSNETQCALVVGFAEKLLRISSEKDLEKEILETATTSTSTISSASYEGSSSSLSPPQNRASSSSSFNKDRLIQLLVAQVELSKKKNPEAAKYWPRELSDLYKKVAEENVVNRMEKKHLFNAVSSLAQKLMKSKEEGAKYLESTSTSSPSSKNNNNNENDGKKSTSSSSANQQQQQLLMIAQARKLLDTIFDEDNNNSNQKSNFFHQQQQQKVPSSSSSSPNGKKLQEAISQLQKAVSENSARTVKVHYESNLRLVRLEDSFSFSKTMSDIQESLDISTSTLSDDQKGPLRIRVADEDGDFITVVSQREWDLILKEHVLASSSSRNNNSDVSNKLELYLDHVRTNNSNNLIRTPGQQQQQQQQRTPPPPQLQQQPAANHQKNVFTTSNAATNQQRPMTGFAFKQHQPIISGAGSPKTPITNNKGFHRPTTSSAAKKSTSTSIQSLAIEGRSPQQMLQQINDLRRQNNDDDDFDDGRDVGFDGDETVTPPPPESEVQPNYPISLHFSPPGSKDPQPEQFPSRVLQQRAQEVNKDKIVTPKGLRPSPPPPSVSLAEKLKGARNKKNEVSNNNDNDDDGDENSKEEEPGNNNNKKKGFWQTPGENGNNQNQEFDLMTVASNSTVATAKTDAESLMMMQALAKKKWGGGGAKKNVFSNNDDAFELQTVASEATNGFHLEDHLDLLMGQQQEKAKNLNNNQPPRSLPVNNLNLAIGGIKKNNNVPSTTHNRIFGGNTTNYYSPFPKKTNAAGVESNNKVTLSKKKDDFVVQGKSANTPR